MKIPFTVEQFFAVFKTYNEAIWPAQIIAYVLALSVIVALMRPARWSNSLIIGVLAI